MNAWILLGIAAAVNATAGILLKQGRVVADGAPILQMALSPWFLGACLCYLGNVFLFAKTLDYLPVSLVYPAYAGAGFAMMEGVLMLARILRLCRVELTERPPPVPVAHLTVRAQNGIWLRIVRR